MSVEIMVDAGGDVEKFDAHDRLLATTRVMKFLGQFRGLATVAATIVVSFVPPRQVHADVLDDTIVTQREPQELLQEIVVPIATDYSVVNLVSRFEAQLAFRMLARAGQYQTAMPIGSRMIELTEEEYGEQSIAVALALTEYADIQRRLGEYDASEDNFQSAIDILRDKKGDFCEELISPLMGLGSTYNDAGDYSFALSIYEQARSVSRRVYGLLSEKQIGILDRMTETMINMRRLQDAHDYQVKALQLAERNRGTDSAEILPAIYKYSRWLRKYHNYRAERAQYSRAMELVESHYGEESIHMLLPLRETANSFRAQQIPETRGVMSLRQALSILKAQEHEDILSLAEIFRDLGDWYVAFEKPRKGETEYLRAWELLGRLESGETYRREWFQQPDLVLYKQPDLRGIVSTGAGDGVEPGFVLVEFDVNDRGSTENVRVIDSVPPGRYDRSVVQAVRRSRFRPSLVDGQLARAEGVSRKFTYFFRPENSD